MVELTINGLDTTETSLKVGEIVNYQIKHTDNGVAEDLSAATLKIVVKLKSGGAEVLTVNTVDMDMTDAVNGIVYYPLDTSSGFDAGAYVYDILITSADGTVKYCPTINLTMIAPITV